MSAAESDQEWRRLEEVAIAELEEIAAERLKSDATPLQASSKFLKADFPFQSFAGSSVVSSFFAHILHGFANPLAVRVTRIGYPISDLGAFRMDCADPVFVGFEFFNPLDIPITLADICLQGRYVVHKSSDTQVCSGVLMSP